MLPADAILLVEGFVDDVLTVLYGFIPEVLTGVGILMAIGIGVRYAFRWIKKAAR